MKIFTILLILFVISFSSRSEENCSDERKQWVEFYKHDFAKNFDKIEYSKNNCLIEILSSEISNSPSSLLILDTKSNNNTYFEYSDVSKNINWVPEYFEKDANFDYLYGIYYFHHEKYLYASVYFEKFLENNINHKLAPKAMFLRGESFRFLEEYIDAAEQYVEGYDKFYSSEYTPINSMRLGEMMVEINEEDMGCKILNNVINSYTFEEDDIYKQTEKLMFKYKCKKIEKEYDKIMLSNLIKITRNILK